MITILTQTSGTPFLRAAVDPAAGRTGYAVERPAYPERFRLVLGFQG